MADVNASINVTIATTAAVSQLRQLQSQINSFNNSVARGNAAAAASQGAMAKSMSSMIASSGHFATSIHSMETSTKQLGTAFDRGTLSARQYFRYAASQVPGLVKAFRSLGAEQAAMSRLAETRVKKLQTQYASLGKDIHGMERVLAARPLTLPKGMATDLALAQQRAQLFNRALQLGSTGLVNWGKNTQWAGRQLMVGFTVPLTIAAGAAAKFYMEIDKASMQFRRVYGDLNTSTQETTRNLEAVKALGVEYTKYGVAVKDTIGLAARAAATGAQNQDLMAATEQTLRLGVLGQMDYQAALDATISLQTAFAISSDELGNKINFLNAVENQTVLTMEDMALAVPRVAPVIKGLGGDVEDLAVFMTALREGGVSAENGANALKSGLASLINPTVKAQESLQKLGININEIVQTNKGDLMGTVRAFGEALSALGDFEQQQALETVFGKYQYAKIGALFKNIANDTSQAARAMDIAKMSTSELANMAEKELGIVSETVTNKFLGAIERLKVAMAPIGETFLKALTPIIDAISSAFDWFSKLPDGVKTAISAIVGIVAGIAPIVLMGIGLLGNAIGNGLKFILALRMGFKGLLSVMTGGVSSFKYMTEAEIESQAAMASLTGSVSTLTGDLLIQQGAVDALIGAYTRLASAARTAASSMPTGFAMPGMVRGGVRPPTTTRQGFNSGVVGVVPGTGNKDTVPAILTPGESVITKKATQKYKPVLQAMNAGTLKQLYGGEVDLNNVYTNIYGETAARLQPKTENISQRASVPQLHQVMPILALRAGEVQNIKLTQANLTAGLFDPIARDLTGITRKFLKQVGQHFHGTYKHIEDTDQRLRAAWTHAGRSMVADVEALPAQYRQVFRRFAGLDPDVVNTLATAKRNPGDTVLSSRRQPIQTISVSGVKSLAETGMNPLMVRAQQRWFSHIAVPEQQDIGHIYGGTRVPMSYFAGMPGLTAEPQRALREVTGNPNAVFPNTKQAARAGAENADAYTKAAQKNMQDPAQLARKNVGASPTMGIWATQDARVYSETFRAKVGTIQAPVQAVPLGTPGQFGMTGAGNITATRFGPVAGTSIRVNGGVAKVLNARNNPNNWGVAPSQAIPVSQPKAIQGPAGAARDAYEVRRIAEREQERRESQARKVVDRRLTGAKREIVPIIGQEKTWLDRNNEASRNLANQRNLYATALAESTKAEQSRNAQSARVAAQAATANMRPATGRGILSRVIAPFRRLAYPEGRGGLRNVAIDPYKGSQTTRQILRSEGPQIRTAISERASSMWTSARNSLNGYVTQLGKDLKGAGSEMVSASKQFKQKLSGFFAGGSGGGGGKTTGGFFSGMGDFFRKRPQYDEAGNFVGMAPSRFSAGFGRGAMAGGMALSMAAMVPFMMQDQQGKFMGMNANALGMGMMGGGALLSMAPMLGEPLTALIAAVAAAGVAMYALRNNIDESARAASIFGANIGGAANALNNMASMLGRQTPAQRQVQMQLGFTQAQQEMAFGQFQSMFNTEAGQKFIEDLKNATSADRFNMLSQYIKTAVASGMMDSNTAKLFAKTVSSALEDAVLGTAIISEITKGIEQGSKGLLELARERNAAVQQNQTIANVQTQGEISYQDSATAIGASLQVIQDFSNAAALAREEYMNGTISYNEYIAILNEATNAQAQYSGVLKDAIDKTSDIGGTAQALDKQLQLLVSPEDFTRIKNAANIGTDFAQNIVSLGDQLFELMPQQRALMEIRDLLPWTPDKFKVSHKDRMRIETETRTMMAEAIVSGMNAASVSAIQQYIKDNPESLTAKTFQQYSPQGGAAAYGAAGFAGNVEVMGLPKGLGALGLGKQEYIKIAAEFVQKGGTYEDFQVFLNTLPDEKRVTIFADFKGLKPEQQIQMIANWQKLSGQVGAQTAGKIWDKNLATARASRDTQGQTYESKLAPLEAQLGQQKKALTLEVMTGGSAERIQQLKDEINATQVELDAINKEVYEIKINLDERDQAAVDNFISSGLFENPTAMINIVLREDPPDLTSRLPELIQYAQDLNDNLPPEIQKIIGIDIQNISDLDKYGPMAEQLGNLSEVIQAMPDGVDKEYAYKLIYTEGGKLKDPLVLAKDLKKYQAALAEFEGGKTKKIKKQALIELATMAVDENGKSITPQEAQQSFENILAETGLSESQFFNLPPDYARKALNLQIDADQFIKAAEALEEAASAAAVGGDVIPSGQSKTWFAAAQRLRAAAAKAQASASAAVAAGQAAGGGGGASSGGGGGGGGGGGEPQKSPFEQMMEDLKTQLKLIGDYTKKGKEVTAGFATALRNAGAPEYLIAEIVAKGADGIKLAKQLLADKQKKLKELMDLSLEVSRMTFVESQRAAARNFKTQGIAQNALFGAGIDPTTAIDVASDPAQAEMVARTYQQIQQAQAKLEEAKRKGKGVKGAKKDLEEARKAWEELTGSIKRTTKAQEEFNIQSVKGNIRVQKKALVTQGAALTRLMTAGFSFQDAQQFAGDEAIANAIRTAGQASDAAARRVAYLNKELKNAKKGTDEYRRLKKELKEAEKQADKTSKKYKSLLDDLKSLTAEQRANLITNTTNEYKGLTEQLDKQLTVISALVAAGISYAQASEMANDPERVTAFYDALQKGGDAWENLIAQAKAYDQKLADISVASKVFEFQQLAKKNLRITDVNAIAKSAGGQYSGLVSEYLMGMTPEELEAFFRMTEQQQKDWIANLLSSIPAAEKIKYLFEQITAQQKYQSTLNKDATNSKKGDIELLDEQLKAQQKLLKAEQDKLKPLEKQIKLLEESNNDYNRGLELLSRQEDAINKTFDDRLSALDKVEQANTRIAQQQQNQLSLSQALSQGDIYAATQAAQQIKQDNATAAIENTRTALEEARTNALKNLQVDVNGELLTREQIEKRIEANNDRIYQITENQIEPIQAVIETIQDEIDRIQDLKDAWQEYFDWLEKTSEITINGVKFTYKELQDIASRFNELMALPGMTAENAFSQLIADLQAAGKALSATEIQALQSYFGVTSTTTPGQNQGDQTTTPPGGATTQDVTTAREEAIKALPEVQKVLDAAKAIKQTFTEIPAEIAKFTTSLIDTAQPAITDTAKAVHGIIERFKNAYKYLNETLNPEIETMKDKFIRMETAVTSINDTLPKINDYVPTLVKTLKEQLLDIVTKISDKVDNLNTKSSGLAQLYNNAAAAANALAAALRAAAAAAAALASASSGGGGGGGHFAGGLIKFATGGAVPGGIPRDSTPIMASPGEFVIRNTMVDKYGMPLLNSINQGSFDPTFRTPSSNNYGNVTRVIDTNNSSTMYNNNYSISVTANTNANADDIASATVMKIRQLNSMQIRGARG